MKKFKEFIKTYENDGSGDILRNFGVSKELLNKNFGYEGNYDSDINIIVDVSGSINPSDINKIPQLIDCEHCNNINVIFVDSEVREVKLLNDISELDDPLNSIPAVGGRTDLQAGINYIVDNGLADNKTYIISDFYGEPLDYSELSEYEEIQI